MSTPETIIAAKEPIRPLKRVEYEQLARSGSFDDERVELLFGMVVPMTPIDQAHVRSGYLIKRALEQQLGARAIVFEGAPFAASDISEPEPDVLVTENVVDWENHAAKAFLVVEVSRTSLRRDTGPKTLLYGLADVVEYWIVDQVHGVVEVHRDRDPGGGWRTKRTFGRGETIATIAFPDVTIVVDEILPPPELIGG